VSEPGGRAARALAAAVAVAADHGLVSTDPLVLHDGMNVLVHLRPAPVVARVATLTALLRDGDRSFRREVALAGALARAGAAVVAPSDVVPPGPHAHDGTAVSFWRHVEVLPERPSPVDAGRSLAALQEVLAGVDPGWDGEPLDTPLEDLAAFARRGPAFGADPSLATRAGELAAALRGHLAPDTCVLHGDAHPGNLLATPSGWVWADLEDTCRGPRAWDLAVLRWTRQLDGRAAMGALADPPSDADLEPYRRLRLLHGAAWWFVHAVRVPEDLPTARQRLAAAVAEVSAGLDG
jgi:aminoglycoside phosphotransferase (APT) family kinase protein